MRYLTFALPDEFLDRVALVPTDPRDGPVESHRVADGTPLQAVLRLLPLCDTAELHDLRLHVLPGIQRKVAAEERARLELAAETVPPAGRETQVTPAGEIRRELDRAVREELLAQEGL